MIGHQEDLAAALFVALRNSLAEPGGAPLPFTLRPKASTQDDPFDVTSASVWRRRSQVVSREHQAR